MTSYQSVFAVLLVEELFRESDKSCFTFLYRECSKLTVRNLLIFSPG